MYRGYLAQVSCGESNPPALFRHSTLPIAVGNHDVWLARVVTHPARHDLAPGGQPRSLVQSEVTVIITVVRHYRDYVGRCSTCD
jgi:hypothetical protein